jgi:hypothetical protein
MSILSGLGGIANGWMKFGVAIAAALWLGGQALDRVLPMRVAEKASTELDSRSEMLVSTTSTEQNADEPEKIEEASSADSNVVPASATRHVSAPRTLSAVEEIGGEMSSGVKAIAVSPVTHTGTAGIVGLLVGLLARPSVDWLKKKRRLAVARKRLSLLEEDYQLLAENGVPSKPASTVAQNAASTSIQLPSPQV